MEEIVALCKRRGFVFPSSEIYGGLGSTYDYGHYGVLLKNNVKAEWWRAMLQERDDIVALDSAILQHPRVWEASGHLEGFTDPLVQCLGKCKKRWREDHLREAVEAEGGDPSAELRCPECGGELSEPRQFNLMFETHVGPVAGRGLRGLPAARDRAGHLHQLQERARLRPQEAAVRDRPDRQVLPQRDHPRQLHLPHPRVRADGDGVLRAAGRRRAVARELDGGARALVHRPRHPPRPPARPRPRRRRALPLLVGRPPTSSTSSRWAGRSSRGSPTAATSTSPSTPSSAARSSSTSTSRRKERYVPHVIEPAAGADRATLAFLVDAYDVEEVEGRQRTVLRLHPRLAPVKVAVLPLVSKEGMPEKAREIFEELRAPHARPSSTRAARSASATAARTRSAPPGASPSTTRRWRTTPSPCATATRSSRRASRSPASPTTSPPASPSPGAARSWS